MKSLVLKPVPISNCITIAAVGLLTIVGGTSLAVLVSNIPTVQPMLVWALVIAAWAGGLTMILLGYRLFRLSRLAPRDQESIEDRLDELERLKRRDMVTPGEYAAKRQEILEDL